MDTADSASRIARPRSKTYGLRAVVFLLALPLLVSILALPLVLATDDWHEHRFAQYGVGIAGLWIVAALAVAQARREGPPGPRQWFARLRFIDVLIAAGILAAGTAFMYLFSQWTGTPRAWHLPQTTSERLLWIVLCVSVGLCEEVIYRGYCLSRLTVALRSATWAWIVQAVFYGLLHYGFGPVWMGFTTGVGLLMGWLVLWRKSLWPAIIVHVLADLAVLVGGA